MADSGSVRTRRSRAHAAGNHQYCLPRNCPDAVRPPENPSPVSPPPELALGGQRLFQAVSDRGPIEPTTQVMLIEACRIVDRLDRLDGFLAGREFLRLRSMEGREGHVTIHVDRALAEAREQANTLRQLLLEIDRATRRGQTTEETKGGGVLADLTARIAERRAQTTG